MREGNVRSSSRQRIPFACLLAVILSMAGSHLAEGTGAPAAALKVTSAAFEEGQPIPAKYTCDGRDMSPSLQWSGAPPGTQSFALICEDPDAPGGTWTHWVLYDLPATVTELPENVRRVEAPPSGGRQGVNSFKRTGYGGPCPPEGSAHRYYFRVYALDSDLKLKPKARREDLERAMAGHILAQGQLMGTYQRK